MKRIISTCLVIVLLLIMVTPASASTVPIDAGNITYQLIDNSSFIDENGNIQYFCTDCPQSRHFSLILHTHNVTNVTGPTRHSEYAGVLAETEEPAGEGDILSGSKTKTVSNTYSVTIDFSASAVSSAVGYSVTATESTTASYEAPLKKGEMARILYYDVYDRMDFTAVTNYYSTLDGEAIFMYSETGTGYSLDWSHYSFSVEKY